MKILHLAALFSSMIAAIVFAGAAALNSSFHGTRSSVVAQSLAAFGFLLLTGILVFRWF